MKLILRHVSPGRATPTPTPAEACSGNTFPHIASAAFSYEQTKACSVFIEVFISGYGTKRM